MAAARLGLRRHVYCEDRGPAFDVAAAHHRGRLRRRGGARRASPRAVDVVTYEFENVPVVDGAASGAARAACGPSAEALEVAQDRLVEKEFIAGARHPGRAVRAVDGRGRPARRALAGSRRAGDPEDAPPRLRRQGPGERRSRADDRRRRVERGRRRPCVLERRIAFACEISVLVVRGAGRRDSPATTARVNTHEDGILRRSVVPSGLPDDDLAARATSPAASPRRSTMSACSAVEMFYLGARRTGAERLMVNEIAPRVHNSGHWTIEACAVEPVREPHPRRRRLAARLHRAPRDAEMVNLIGDEALDWRALAAEPGAACTSTASARPARAQDGPRDAVGAEVEGRWLNASSQARRRGRTPALGHPSVLAPPMSACRRVSAWTCLPHFARSLRNAWGAAPRTICGLPVRRSLYAPSECGRPTRGD